MRNYKKITVLFILFLAVIFLLPKPSLAQDFGDWGLNNVQGLNLGTRSLGQIVVGIINIALGFLGVIFTGLVLYAGYTWMTAAGNADKIEKAKKTLINGVIGLAIIASAYAIVRFVFKDAMDIINNTNTGNNGGGGGGTIPFALGAGVLDSHYPAPNATGIPRNTNIYITFNEDMNVADILDPASCINGPGGTRIECDTNVSHIRVFPEGQDSNYLAADELEASYDPANPRVFAFNPYGADANLHLGNPSGDTRYRVYLLDLQTANAQAAFPYSPDNSYWWRFTVSNIVDLTPPRVVSVIPIEGAIDVPRNTIVQVNFSEAVNPIFAAGHTDDGFQNINLNNGGLVAGEWVISNQYKTVEFITDNNCGTNSCGDRIFCLDSTGLYTATVNAVNDNGLGQYIRDMADNEMEGPNGDNDQKIWSFTVIDTIDVAPPVMISQDDIDGVLVDEPIQVVFNEPILSSSVRYTSVRLRRYDASSGTMVPINYWIRMQNRTNSSLDNRTIQIHHESFLPSTTYEPMINSGIKNTTQNCWQPCVCDVNQGSLGGECNCTSPACSGPSCAGNPI